MRGLPALALERLDQRRFFTADVGARPEMDRDVEVESLRPADAGAEPPVPAHRLQPGFQGFEQVAIFAAQIEETMRRADGEARNRHAFENALCK